MRQSGQCGPSPSEERQEAQGDGIPRPRHIQVISWEHWRLDWEIWRDMMVITSVSLTETSQLLELRGEEYLTGPG